MAEILSGRDGAVATITISNPAKHNAVTPDMWDQLKDALDAADADEQVRVIVLVGAGDKAFVSGADIGKIGKIKHADPDEVPLERRGPYMAPMACRKPVIAKIRGICMGGGLGLAAACDIRICSDDAVFAMPAGRLGVGYSHAGVRHYIQLIGPQNTLDIFFSARKFDAAEALRMGFVSRVIPAAELDAHVAAYCAQIAANAPLTLMAAKRSVLEELREPREREFSTVQAVIDRCLESEDFAEGRKAFLEKRKPVWRGR